MNENNNIEQSFLDTIKNDNLKDLATDYSELAFDSFLNDGLLKDIPFFGTLYKGFKGFLGVRDALFATKVYKFLTQIKDIPLDERKKFIEDIESEETEKIKVGQALLLILDKLDDLNKPKIIGNLFKATIKEQITYDVFLRLSSIVQRAFLSDLIKLNNSNFYSEVTKDHFYSIGLMRAKIKEDYSRARASFGGPGQDKPDLLINYELTDLACTLYKYGLNGSS